MSTERLRQRLADIVRNGERLQRHLAGHDQGTFVDDEQAIDSVERCFERIAEAGVKITNSDARALISIDVEELQALRQFGNKLRHAYEVIAPDQLWVHATRELPELLQAARAELTALDAGTDTGGGAGSSGPPPQS